MAGSTNANYIAAWDGGSWSALGSGMNGGSQPYVFALTVYNNKLIAGGLFTTAGGTNVNYIAGWDGSSWSALGSGMNSLVYALAIYNDKLIAGGNFTTAGAKVSAYVAEWNKPATDVGEDEEASLPGSFALRQNYPNPFNPTTSIEYAVPTRSHVNVEIFNLLGQHVRTLVDEMKSAGTYKIEWDGTDAAGKSVSTGVYLYRFKAGDYVETKKMLMLK